MLSTKNCRIGTVYRQSYPPGHVLTGRRPSLCCFKFLVPGNTSLHRRIAICRYALLLKLATEPKVSCLCSLPSVSSFWLAFLETSFSGAPHRLGTGHKSFADCKDLSCAVLSPQCRHSLSASAVSLCHLTCSPIHYRLHHGPCPCTHAAAFRFSPVQ